MDVMALRVALWPLIVAALLDFFPIAVAQYFPPTPQGVQTIQSKLTNGVKISYKEVPIHNLGVKDTVKS
jgi:hypothetical protein